MGRFSVSRRRNPGNAVCPIDSADTSPSPHLVIKICCAPRAAYPAGTGSVTIPLSMPPNSRRVRWLSAGQQAVVPACRIRRPPVFTSRCRKLVSDQVAIRVGSTSRRHRLPTWATRLVVDVFLILGVPTAVRPRLVYLEDLIALSRSAALNISPYLEF
jgi:hypothetical protein